MPRVILLAQRLIQRQHEHSSSCKPHASWSSAKDVEGGVVLRLLPRVGQCRVIPAGTPRRMPSFNSLKRSGINDVSGGAKRVKRLHRIKALTDMREAQRRILEASFPVPGVTNDALSKRG